MPDIYVTRQLPDSAIALLYDAFGEESVRIWPEDRVIPRETLLREAAGTDAILAMLTDKIDAELMDAAGKQLRIVANMAVGYDNIAVPAATERGIPVTNTPGVLTETTADLAWTLILGATRLASPTERYLRRGDWTSWSPTHMLGFDVYGKTLGLYGMGRIGQAVALRAIGFGMRVRYYNRNRLPAEVEATLDAEYVAPEVLLQDADILSVHCPLSPETTGLFDAAKFAAMKSTAVFINTARGPIVDEAALAHALRTGEIFAAGLDVFEEEPKVHPELLACENAMLLPHIGSATLETRSAMANMAAENIVARLNGKTPPNAVNPEALRGGLK